MEAERRYSRGSENQLTEVFATVIAAHSGFRKALLAALGLPGGTRSIVQTQKYAGAGLGTVDMEIVELDKAGVVSRVWCEHKHLRESVFQENQLPRYQRGLDSLEGRCSALLAIVPSLEALEALQVKAGRRQPRWHEKTWQEIGELAELAGRSVGGARWHTNAVKPTASARDRLLAEFVYYLEVNGYAMTEPITRDSLNALGMYPRASRSSEALVQAAADLVDLAWKRGSEGRSTEREYVIWEQFEGPRDAWYVELGGFPEIVLSSDDRWSVSPEDEPAFGAGITFEQVDAYQPLFADENWNQAIEGNGFRLFEWSENVNATCYRKLPQTDLLKEATLAGQARLAASWANRAFDDLLKLAPSGVRGRREASNRRKGMGQTARRGAKGN